MCTKLDILNYLRQMFDNIQVILIDVILCKQSFDNSETLVQFMSENLKLQHLPTNATTDYGSVLDHFYTSFAKSDIEGWGALEPHYSDHKPLYITLK